MFLSSASQAASLSTGPEPKPDSFTDVAFIVYSSGAHKDPGATLGQKIEAGEERAEIPASLQLSAPSKVMKN